MQSSFTASGFHVSTLQFAPSTTPASQVPSGILYPAQDGKNICEAGFRGLVYYTSFAVAPTSTPQGQASNFYGGPVGLDASFPQNKNDNAGPSLDGHAALTFDATQVLVAAVQHLRLGNASIPITPGDVWREISTIRGSSPGTPSHPHPNNDALQGVTGVIDFSATGAALHYPADKQVAILQVQQGTVATKLAFFCGDPADPRQSPHCPIDTGND